LYGDYVEQLTFLLFLEMADEQTRPPSVNPSPIPKRKDWPALLAKDGDELDAFLPAHPDRAFKGEV
jgi:type I restriction enzyme M protein